MDLSTLTEDQRKQLQQLNQQFQQHQLEQQQKQRQQQQQQQELQQQQLQESVSQAYDPSQAQPYDQSTQAYYNYHHYQHNPYYYPDYANVYYHQSQQSQPHPTAVQPPGISTTLDASQGQLQVQQPHNAYYMQPESEQQQASSSAFAVPAGLNPAAAAAVAALSQLTQFAGNMDAAERAMAQERQWQSKVAGYGPSPGPPMPMMPPPPHPPHMLPPGGFPRPAAFPGPVAGRHPFRGGGRRGGGPSRGNGRGNFGQFQSKPDGSASQFRGRGRGKGGGRQRQLQHDSLSHLETTSVKELALASVPLVAGDQGELQHSAPLPSLAVTQGKATTSRRQPQIAWCELCRVDCTSLEVLEQHKNGKKHKKNLQKSGETQNTGNSTSMPVQMPAPVAAATSVPAPVPVSETASASVAIKEPVLEVQNQAETQIGSKSEVTIGQPANTEGCESNMRAASENKPIEVDNDANAKDIQQNNLTEKTEVGEEAQAPARKRRLERLDGGRRMKKNVKHGRGGKRLRNADRPNKPVESPKVVTPKVCDLCNVKCDTQAVFDSHLAGKKHLSKLKRFQTHQATYGQVGLQALYPPNPNAPPIFIPSLHQQGLYFPHGPLPPMPYLPPNPEQESAASGCLAKQGAGSAQLAEKGSEKVNDQAAPTAVDQGHEGQVA